MSLLRRAVRRDESEKAIVEALRESGWTVCYLSSRNGPDLLAGRAGQSVLIECKTKNRKLKPGQAVWHAEWRGSRVYIMRSVEDVIALNEERANGNSQA